MKRELSPSEMMNHVIADIHSISKNADERIGIPLERRISPIRTWMRNLDETILGFHPGQLYVLGGRPGDGKTSFATTITANIIKNSNQSVLFISTELTPLNLVLQVGEAMSGGIPTAPKTSTLSDAAKNTIRLSHTAIFEAMTEHRLSILHTKKLSAEGISKAIYHHTRVLNDDQISLVIIDQANRIKREDKNRHGYAIATEHLLNSLEEIASNSHVPVLLVTQLNRAAEIQARPTMASIKHSGGLEEYAHCVLLLNRQREGDEIIVAKNRDGRAGPIPAEFIGEAHTWKEIIKPED